MYARTARLPANTRSPAAPAMLRCLPHTALRAYSLLSSTIASTAYAGASIASILAGPLGPRRRAATRAPTRRPDPRRPDPRLDMSPNVRHDASLTCKNRATRACICIFPVMPIPGAPFPLLVGVRARAGIIARSQHRSVIWSLPGLVAEASTHELQPLFSVGHGLLACSRVGMYLYRAAPMSTLYAPPPRDSLCRAHRARAARAFDQIRQVRRVKEPRPNKEGVNVSVNWFGVK